jgi:hypothetical protein
MGKRGKLELLQGGPILFVENGIEVRRYQIVEQLLSFYEAGIGIKGITYQSIDSIIFLLRCSPDRSIPVYGAYN